LPQPTKTVQAAWNKLEGGTSKLDTSNISVGLFGYDVTCFASYCAETKDMWGICDFVKAKGIDGLSFGVYFKLDYDVAAYYCAGFHNAERTDTFVCA
jgi:hypothetical protein